MNRALTAAIVVILAMVAMVRGEQRSARGWVAQANEAYRAGQFEEALRAYNEAEVDLPESPEVAYNQGLAKFKLGDFAGARNAFMRALGTRDIDLEAGAKYNLGNVAYASALEKMSDLQEAVELLKQSIGHYRDALEIAPSDEDARANIELAQLLIKDLLDKLKKEQEQQQQENQDQQENQEQQQDQQEQGDQQEDDGEGDQEEKQQQEQQEGEEQQQGSQDQQQQSEGDVDQQDEPSGEEDQPAPAEIDQQREMSPEEAERLLQAVRDKERQRRDEKAQRVRARRGRVVKDW